MGRRNSSAQVLLSTDLPGIVPEGSPLLILVPSWLERRRQLRLTVAFLFYSVIGTSFNNCRRLCRFSSRSSIFSIIAVVVVPVGFITAIVP